MSQVDPLPEYDATRHLVFNTEAQAIAAEAQISASMGFTGSITSRWDIPRQCADGRWIIAKPPE